MKCFGPVNISWSIASHRTHRPCQPSKVQLVDDPNMRLWRVRRIDFYSNFSAIVDSCFQQEAILKTHTSEWSESVVINPQVVKVLTLLNRLFCSIFWAFRGERSKATFGRPSGFRFGENIAHRFRRLKSAVDSSRTKNVQIGKQTQEGWCRWQQGAGQAVCHERQVAG